MLTMSKVLSSYLTLFGVILEVMESPRYGTLRRQKPNAPSPPTKTESTSNGVGSSHRPHAKELFPHQDDKPEKQEKQEKPAKPPLPNLPSFQQPAAVSQPTHTQLEALPPPPVTPAKPVPMTRTQFFGLDNLPSPTADRRSIDSIGSFRLKPDVPQKPQLPKRPVALGLGSGGGGSGGSRYESKSDDEAITPTQAIIDNGNVRFTTEKFIEKLRHENCDTNGTREEATTGTTSNSASTTTMTSTAGTEHNHNHEHQQSTGEKEQQNLPSTPISPNSFQTPKRPTVPAPPPPTIRKQSE